MTARAHPLFLVTCPAPSLGVPVASLTLQQESPNFLPKKCFLLPLWDFLLRLPERARHTFPILPSSPFHRWIHQYCSGFTYATFPLPPVRAHMCREVWQVLSNACLHQTLPIPRPRAKYLDVRSYLTDVNGGGRTKTLWVLEASAWASFTPA